MATRSAEPSPSRCPWPTNSSRSRGRILVASGASPAGTPVRRLSSPVSNSRSLIDSSMNRTLVEPGASTGRAAPLGVIAREWLRIGVTGFGGPPAHISLLRDLVVERKGWMDGRAFEDANAACSLLPGPSSTQLSIFCAYRVGGPAGAVIGGLGFVVPAVVMVLALSVLFLFSSPPR